MRAVGDALGAVPILAGLAILVVEWLVPSPTRRDHHAWRTVAFALGCDGFTTWLVAYSVRAYIEYRKWRDSDDGPRRRRLRAAGARARALLDRLRAHAPRPLPVPA